MVETTKNLVKSNKSPINCIYLIDLMKLLLELIEKTKWYIYPNPSVKFGTKFSFRTRIWINMTPVSSASVFLFSFIYIPDF